MCGCHLCVVYLKEYMIILFTTFITLSLVDDDVYIDTFCIDTSCIDTSCIYTFCIDTSCIDTSCIDTLIFYVKIHSENDNLINKLTCIF